MLALILAQNISAESQVATPRLFYVSFADPTRSFDANAQAWHSINQAFALGFDAAVSKFALHNNAAERVALLAAATWSNAMLRYYSHELAHEYLYRDTDQPFQSGLDLRHLTSSYLPGLYYPSWRKTSVSVADFSDEQLLRAIAGGLNQDEWNARTVWRFNPNRDDYYNALSFLLPKLRDVVYIIRSGSEERPFAPRQKIAQLSTTVMRDRPQLYDDVNLYRLALLNQNITVSNGTLLRQALAADLLSAQTWESLYALVQFVRGARVTKPLLPSDLPLISYYLTPSGGFYHLELPLQIKGRRHFVSIGSAAGLRPLKEPLRLGIEWNAWQIEHFHAGPFAYFSRLEKGQGGVALGVNADWQVRNFSLWMQLAFYQNDILENRIKGEKATALRFGLRKTFPTSKGDRL